MKVLVADDDLLVRYTLRATLDEAGHETTEARDGREVLERVATDPPEVIILDLMMPEVTGYEVLRWLLANNPERTISVVILSAFVAEDDGFERHPHVVAVLQKPLYVDQLLEALALCQSRCLAA